MGAIFGALWARVFACLAALALALALVQTVRIEGFLWWHGFKATIANLVKENGVLRIDLDRIKLAQEQATQLALDEKRTAEARFARLKETSDENLEHVRDQARVAAARYADAHRVRAETTAAGSAGSADLPCAAAVAQGDLRSCDNAELLAVSRTDFDIMVENSVRLKEAHDWGAAQGD